MEILIIVVLFFLGYIVWDLIETKIINNNRFISDEKFVSILVIDKYGRGVEKIDLKSFGYNSLGLAEPMARNFLNSVGKSSCIKMSEFEKISSDTDKFLAFSLSYFCAIYWLFASKYLLKENQYASFVRHSLIQKFINGISEGADHFFNSKASAEHASLHELFLKSFNSFCKIIETSQVEQISEFFKLALNNFYQVEFDEVGSLSFQLLFDRESDLSAISKFFKISLSN
jgi:hypothetical protein